MAERQKRTPNFIKGFFFLYEIFEFFNLVTHVTKFLQLITLSRKCAQLIELVCQ